VSRPHGAESDGRKDVEWLTRRERGTLLGIRAAFRIATLCGRSATKPIVAAVALYYSLFDRRVANASREWMRRALGRPARFRDVHRHLRTFAQTTLDKVFLLTDHTRALSFSRTGQDLLVAQRATGRGAILLGAHLGSYEAMRAGGDVDDFDIDILGYFANAKMINKLLSELSPKSAARVIHLGVDPVMVMARVAEEIAAGHFIATMGDRTGLSDRVVRVPFLGEEAPFPAGPFLMAAALRCPVYLVFGLYREPSHYDLHCEVFADRIDLPRRDREGALREWVRRYAERVEHHARAAPENWFNFFDFWGAPPSGAQKSNQPTRANDEQTKAT
jgi:predicted LPLAT superfamily acyltransferase